MKLTRITLALCLLLAFTSLASAQNKSLYERLGGQDAISAVVDKFAGKVLADTRINKKFAKTNAARLTHMLKMQLCAATGGPCTYEGLSMKAAHKNMGVTTGEFNALVEDLVATLNEFNVPEAEKSELLSALAPMSKDIVEVNSNATGTPLPKKFKPAKPLKEKDMKMKMGGKM